MTLIDLNGKRRISCDYPKEMRQRFQYFIVVVGLLLLVYVISIWPSRAQLNSFSYHGSDFITCPLQFLIVFFLL